VLARTTRAGKLCWTNRRRPAAVGRVSVQRGNHGCPRKRGKINQDRQAAERFARLASAEDAYREGPASLTELGCGALPYLLSRVTDWGLSGTASTRE
jgi:hypothetical protein